MIWKICQDVSSASNSKELLIKKIGEIVMAVVKLWYHFVAMTVKPKINFDTKIVAITLKKSVKKCLDSKKKTMLFLILIWGMPKVKLGHLILNDVFNTGWDMFSKPQFQNIIFVMLWLIFIKPVLITIIEKSMILLIQVMKILHCQNIYGNSNVFHMPFGILLKKVIILNYMRSIWN